MALHHSQRYRFPVIAPVFIACENVINAAAVSSKQPLVLLSIRKSMHWISTGCRPYGKLNPNGWCVVRCFSLRCYLLKSHEWICDTPPYQHHQLMLVRRSVASLLPVLNVDGLPDQLASSVESWPRCFDHHSIREVHFFIHIPDCPVNVYQILFFGSQKRNPAHWACLVRFDNNIAIVNVPAFLYTHRK